jgi:hypothetical protein
MGGALRKQLLALIQEDRRTMGSEPRCPSDRPTEAGLSTWNVANSSALAMRTASHSTVQSVWARQNRL